MADKSTDYENDVTVAQFYCFCRCVDLKGLRLQRVPFITFFSCNCCIVLTKQTRKDCIYSYSRVVAELAFPPTSKKVLHLLSIAVVFRVKAIPFGRKNMQNVSEQENKWKSVQTFFPLEGRR